MSSCFLWAARIKSKRRNDIKSKQQRASNVEGHPVPSTAMYAITGGKAFAEALENVSNLIPLPFLSQFVNVAIKVLEVCEEATAVEENVEDLQGRIYRLTLVVVNAVPVQNSSSVELRGRIKQLQTLLDDIMTDVNKIKEQKKWLLVFFRNMNKEAVGRCVDRLNEALEQFDVASQLRVEDLLEKIKLDYSTFATQLNRIEEAVNEIKEPHRAMTTISRQDMPPPHHIFLGRDSLVKEITSLLISESTSRVCITGVGGMGKTSVALAVVDTMEIKEVFPKEYIFWVPCIEANSADLFRRILYAQLRVTAQSYDSLDPLIAELNTTKKRRLLLLDNFETTWFSDSVPDRTKIGHILSRLAALPHIALLVTMTAGFAPGTAGIKWQHRSLAALDPISARDTFKVNYRNATEMDGPQLEDLLDESHVDKLLTSIGYIPLAITLLAVGGGRLQSPPEDLLQGWEKAGTAMISVDTMRMDYTISLSVDRAIKLNAEAAPLLAVLSMLPAGTTGDNLAWWASNITHAPAVVALRTAALIEQDSRHFASSRIFVRPTIQSYMSRSNFVSPEVQDKVHTACYKFILDHQSTPDNAKFKDDLKALADEETNIQFLLMHIDSKNIRAHAVDALIAFAFYQSWTKPSTVVAEHAFTIATAACCQVAGLDVAALDIMARRLVQAHRCLGRTLLRLDRYEEAVLYLEAARRHSKTLPGGEDHILLGECSMELAEIWMYMNSVDPSDVALLVTEANTDLSRDANNQYYVATGLLGLGCFLWWKGEDRSRAIETLSHAKQIFEDMGDSGVNCFSIARCLQHIARSFARLNEYTTALAVMEETLANAQQAGDTLLTSDMFLVTAVYLIVLESYDKAFSMIEQGISLARAVGNPLVIAYGLELLGYNSGATMDVNGARIAYDGARAQYANVESGQGRNGAERCLDNLEKLEPLTEMDQAIFSTLQKPDPMY